MANAKRDQNDVPVALGVSTADSSTPIMLVVDPVTNYLLVKLLSDSLILTSATQVKIDQNDRKTAYGVSDTDSVTLIPIRTDHNGNLLVKYT